MHFLVGTNHFSANNASMVRVSYIDGAQWISRRYGCARRLIHRYRVHFLVGTKHFSANNASMVRVLCIIGVKFMLQYARRDVPLPKRWEVLYSRPA